jgi:Flp pilus assembly protein TadG
MDLKIKVERKRAQCGHAVVEVALMAPWIFLLFMGILDFGFYAYSAISVENAARAAALFTSSDPGEAANSAGACVYALQELQNAANIGSGAACDGSGHIKVGANTIATITAVEAAVVPAVIAPCDSKTTLCDASQVTVTYKSPGMIPIPWLPGVYNITRIVTMKQ